MIDERVYIFVAAVMVVALITFGLHDRHYRRRRDVVREARIRALERALPEDKQQGLLEARVDALESILLEDETT
jgi:hypothetical protein